MGTQGGKGLIWFYLIVNSFMDASPYSQVNKSQIAWYCIAPVNAILMLPRTGILPIRYSYYRMHCPYEKSHLEFSS